MKKVCHSLFKNDTFCMQKIIKKFSFFLSVDVTVCHRNFHGDLNETFFVGNVDESSKKLVKVTYECLMQAIDEGKLNLMYHVFQIFNYR